MCYYFISKLAKLTFSICNLLSVICAFCYLLYGIFYLQFVVLSGRFILMGEVRKIQIQFLKGLNWECGIGYQEGWKALTAQFMSGWHNLLYVSKIWTRTVINWMVFFTITGIFPALLHCICYWIGEPGFLRFGCEGTGKNWV